MDSSENRGSHNVLILFFVSTCTRVWKKSMFFSIPFYSLNEKVWEGPRAFQINPTIAMLFHWKKALSDMCYLLYTCYGKGQMCVLCARESIHISNYLLIIFTFQFMCFFAAEEYTTGLHELEVCCLQVGESLFFNDSPNYIYICSYRCFGSRSGRIQVF